MEESIALDPIDNAARQEFEYYGSTLTTNTALKAVCLLLAGVCVVLAYSNRQMAKQVADTKPVVIRIDEVGRAEAVSYHYQSYAPQDPEIRYFLNQFVVNHYSRTHHTLQDLYPASFYYFAPNVAAQVDAEDGKTKWAAKFLVSGDDDVTVNVNNIALDDGQKPLYKALIDFTKIYTNQSGIEARREKYTATLYFKIDPAAAVKDNNLVKANPLGFSIVEKPHVDQAFN
jgi:type IV secretory pathway TrbF-like protein